MSKAEALRAARTRVSPVYRTEAGRGGIMWGFSVVTNDRQGYRRENSIGTYREAQQARAEWIAETAEQMRETA